MAADVHGAVYWCPVCGAEVSVLATHFGAFAPRCCNTAMTVLDQRVEFYVCPRCGAEVGLLTDGAERFAPRCCNTEMEQAA
jgi:predicted RNA-binding Zn-ribbon protein involved in translation (DUF1610 family)